MDKALQLTMFVAITKHSVGRFISLYDIAEQLLAMRKVSYGDFTIIKVVPKCKGRLHTVCNTKQQMGSISLTLRYKDRTSCTYRKANALIFPNTIRIAGGFPKGIQDEIHECVNDVPLKEYVGMITDGIRFWTAECLQPDDDVKVVNINAQVKKPQISRFTSFCAEKLYLNPKFHRVQLPFVHEYGAICTCHVYPLENSNCSAKLQPSGAIQYLGFKDIDMLHVFSLMIDDEL